MTTVDRSWACCRDASVALPSRGNANVMLRLDNAALANERIRLREASSEKRALIVRGSARGTRGSRMDRAPGRFIERACPYVAIELALGNKHDPADQDSRTSFPDKCPFAIASTANRSNLSNGCSVSPCARDRHDQSLAHWRSQNPSLFARAIRAYCSAN